VKKGGFSAFFEIFEEKQFFFEQIVK